MEISSTMKDDDNQVFLLMNNNKKLNDVIDIGCLDDDDADEDTTTTLSSTFDAMESTYAYESFDDIELRELLERFENGGHLLSSSDEDEELSDDNVEDEVTDAGDVSDIATTTIDGDDDDESLKQKRSMFNENVGGGDACTAAVRPIVKTFHAQLVQIRIRPQYIEYLRAKHGWSSNVSFKPRFSQQYIQKIRYALPSPSPYIQSYPPVNYQYADASSLSSQQP